MLKTVGQQLELHFSNNDVVGRLGGDEFAIFSSHLLDEKEIQEKVELVVAILGEIEIATSKEKLSASVGFATYPESGSYDELYDTSDQAMYRMKKKYR